jgi:sec-independent protein translocase protein TatA
MFLFGPIGPTELILILLIVLILFGGRKLGDLGKSLGEGIRNFKKSVGGEDAKAPKDQDKKDVPPAN